MSVLPCIPEKYVMKFNEMVEKFLWNSHKPKISLKILRCGKKQGGLNLVDIERKDKALKATWVKMIMQHAYPSEIPQSFLHSGIGEMLWCCNIAKEDVPLCVNMENPFWVNVIQAWSEYHYTPVDKCDGEQIIWLNSNIRIENKPIWWPIAASAGLMFTSQIIGKDGFISNEAAYSNFKLTTMQMNSLKVAIPSKFKIFCQQNAENVHFTDPKFFAVMDADSPASLIYKQIADDCPAIEAKEAKWHQETGRYVRIAQHTARVWKLSTVAKLRSFEYRLICRALVTNRDLYRWKILDNGACEQCQDKEETIKHLFFECPKAQIVWEAVTDLAKSCKNSCPTLTYDRIVFNEIGDYSMSVLNLICIIAKQYLYKQRCLKEKTNREHFCRYVYHFKNIERYYAVKNGRLKYFEKKWGK